MIALLLGIAAARPPAVLGPDGPVHLGPVPPGLDPAGVVVVVDPWTGGATVEVPTPEGTWAWPGAEPTPGLSLTTGGALSISWDADGRPLALAWSTGERLSMRWSGAELVQADGPGPARLRISGDSEEGTRAFTDVLGGVTRARRQPTPGGGWREELRDGLGRVARREIDGQGRTVWWEDPRGLATRVSWTERGVQLTGPGARRWELGTDAAGRVLRMVDPLGATWAWARDADGRALARADPDGRVRTWGRDSEGRVATVDDGAGKLRLVRDTAGRIVELIDAAGMAIGVHWDALGRVERITDGAGAAYVIERDRGGRPRRVADRAGGAWALNRDRAGQVIELVSPTGGRWSLERDGLGRLAGWSRRGSGAVRLSRGALGVLTRVDAADGRRTGFSWDQAGRLLAVVPQGGVRWQLERGPTGDLVALSGGAWRVDVRRDPAGMPTGAGDIGWIWDAAGRLVGLRSPQLELQLGRDGAGWLRQLRAPGGWELRVERDAAGRPVAWIDPEGEVRLERDPAGRISAERGPAGPLRVSRDARGQVDRITHARGVWRWLRDAEGAVLRVVGPEGEAVGVVRDAAGRSTLERLPAGALLSRAWGAEGLVERLETGAGGVLLEQTLVLDLDGELVETEILGEPRVRWTRDPAGRLMGGASPDGRSWVSSAELLRGPDGQLAVRDAVGRSVEVATTELPAWGVGSGVFGYHRAPGGRLVEVTGPKGRAVIRYDPLGRPVSVDLGGARWGVRWDARGRPGLISWPGGEGHGVLWAPDRVDAGAAPVLASGPGLRRALLPTPRGPAGWTTADGEVHAIGRPAGAASRWVLGVGEPVELPRWPGGWTAGSADGIVVSADRLRIFGGGPELSPRGAWAPVWPEPLDGRAPWPWAAGGEGSAWDPSPWLPESPWGDPVSVLLGLGELDPPEAGGVAAPAADPAVPWLPAAFDRAPAPLAGLEGLPLDVDPLSGRLIAHLLSARGPAGEALLPGALLDDLPQLPLPPGMRVPGLTPLWTGERDPWTAAPTLDTPRGSE